MTKKKRINLSFSIMIIFFLQITLAPASVFCGQVAMMWDKSIGPGIDGYRVFCREENSSYNYSQPSWQSADTRCVLQDLDENKTHYAVVRAYNTGGIESPDSNEVNFQPCPSYPILSENFFYRIVIEGETVILDYIDNLEQDYTITKYLWAQIEGSPVVLSDPTAAVPTFTAPSAGESGTELRFIVEVKTADNFCDTAEISLMIEDGSYRVAESTDGGGSGGCFISGIIFDHL